MVLFVKDALDNEYFKLFKNCFVYTELPLMMVKKDIEDGIYKSFYMYELMFIELKLRELQEADLQLFRDMLYAYRFPTLVIKTWLEEIHDVSYHMKKYMSLDYIDYIPRKQVPLGF